MKTTLRGRALGAALVGALAVTAFATAVPAQADNEHDFAYSQNASDPHAYRCYHANAPGKVGWCMVMSEDLNDDPIGSPGADNYNPYPMNRTLLVKSTDGLHWESTDDVLTEWELRTVVDGERSSNVYGTNHMWAPAMRYLHYSDVRLNRPENNYYLYTPNLNDRDDRLSSRIWVTYSKYNGPFGLDPIMDLGSVTETQIQGVPNDDEIESFIDRYPLYMSDPEVFTDTTATEYWDHRYVNRDYLIWADGDNGTCGGLSMRKMTNAYTVQKFSHPNQAWLTINGLNSGSQALGTCEKKYLENPKVIIDRPYIEGGSLYHSSRWEASETREGHPGAYVLVFAAKPSGVPAPCKKEFGEPGTSHEVIAYATAHTVTGPYTYQGIIMCGSSSEWTNQATIQEVKAPDGTSRLVLIYHDGPAGTHNRQLHAECLYSVNGKFIKTMRSADGVSELNGDTNWCLQRSEVVAFKSVSEGKFVTAKSDGLEATASYVGPYEQFSFTDRSGSSVEINARRTDRFAAPSTTKVKVTADGRANIKWTLELVEGTRYRIKGEDGRYLRASSAGVIYSASTNPSSSDTSYHFGVEALSN